MNRGTFHRAALIGLVAGLILVLSVAVAFALTMGNADGKWSNAVSAGGAGTTVGCLYWGNPNNWSTNVNTYQDTSTTDENQVRFGGVDDANDCTPHASQSGFGFDGTNGPLTFTPGDVFALGKFVHYNNPVYFNPNDKKLRYVDLAVTLDFDDPSGLEPVLGYTVELDETPNNSNPCPYGDSTGNGCDDKVSLPATMPDQTFVIDGVTYTLQIIGFVPADANACPAQPTGAPVNQFITGEKKNNYACLYAKIVLPIDSGDAPDLGLGQTTGASRASHFITAGGPYLGALRPDGENDGQPTANADGDDVTDYDDEDGIVSMNDSYWADGGALTVAVNMGTASRACVYAWVDWAGDGFGVGQDSVAQASTTSSGNLVLTFPADANMPAAGSFPPTAVIRLRVQSGGDSCGGLGATGAAPNGEVEDHLLSFGPNAVTLSAFTANANSGQRGMIWLFATMGLVTLAGLGAFVGLARVRQNRLEAHGPDA